MKIVINRCFGGFSLSKEAYEYMGLPWDGYGLAHDLPRTSSELIKCIESLGDKANGVFAELGIVEIPDDIEYTIEEYDGCEHIAEKHRTWY